MKTKKTPTMSLRVLWSSKRFRFHVALFVLFNCLLYGWIMLAHQSVSFNKLNYNPAANHYVNDIRANHPERFNMLDALAVYDSQWYLRIATHGYPKPTPANNQPVYAFPPLYPMAIAATHVVVRSYLLSAFIVTQLLLLGGFVAIYWLVSRWYTASLAAKTAWLIFLFPSSVFYRSYFSEGLFLLLLVIFLEMIRSKRWAQAAVAAGFLSVTRIVGVAGIAVLFWQLWAEKPRIRRRNIALYTAISLVPLLLFGLYCAIQAGDPLQSAVAQHDWLKYNMLFPGSATLWSIAHFFSLPWHAFHFSRIDVLSIILSGGLLAASRKWLPQSWWRLSLLLWLIPILTNDTMSATRFQIVNLPLFLYAAHMLKEKYYVLTLLFCLIGLLITSLLFVNWVWIG